MAPATPDVLLATKLEVPPHPGLVRRPRLLERLAPETGSEATLVCAPAGCGKTSLLADWARSGGRPVAWLSLDPGDNDPVRFWRYVAAALDRAGVAVAGRLAPLLCGPDPASPEAVVIALVDELAARPGPEPVVLLLDDYHLVQAPPVHHGITLLLDHPPPQLRLVLAGRADPPLSLARLRALGQLAEVRAADLRFRPTEAAALLARHTGQPLPDQAVAAWPPAPKAGPPASSWPGCRCATTPTRPGSWPASRAATVLSWTI